MRSNSSSVWALRLNYCYQLSPRLAAVATTEADLEIGVPRRASADRYFSMAPDGLASHAGKACRAQQRDELREFSFVYDRPGEPGEGMRLACTGTGALRANSSQLAGGGMYLAGAFSQSAEIEPRLTGTIQGAKSADTVADASRKSLEWRQSITGPTLYFRGC